jgi:NADH:ubiquinone oxidoreductase subunit K
LIIALFFVIVAFSGKCKDSDSQVLAVIIAFWGIIEFFLYITLGILAFRDHDLASIMVV